MHLSRRLALSGATVAATLGRHAHAASPTIRIGVLTDLSGQYRDNSGPTTVLAAKQAVEDFNPWGTGSRLRSLPPTTNRSRMSGRPSLGNGSTDTVWIWSPTSTTRRSRWRWAGWPAKRTRPC